MKNLKVRKSLTALALSTSLVLSSLSGCGKKEAGNDCTVREYMQSVDEFDLINPDKGETYKIIKTENKDIEKMGKWDLSPISQKEERICY